MVILGIILPPARCRSSSSNLNHSAPVSSSSATPSLLATSAAGHAPPRLATPLDGHPCDSAMIRVFAGSGEGCSAVW